MVPRTLAVLLAALVLGCGSGDTHETPVSETQEAPAVPPAEMRRILEGLRSDRPGVQAAALEALGRFPTVAQTYREHIERLQNEAKDARVRQKAADLLASLEE